MTGDDSLMRLGELEAGIVQEVRNVLGEEHGSRIPLGKVLMALWPVLPVVRASVAIRTDWKEPTAPCSAFRHYMSISDDQDIDLADEGQLVSADDDRILAQVINGGPERIHPVEPARPFDRSLYRAGIRWTAIFALRRADGVPFGTFNCGVRQTLGIDETHRPFLAAVARALEPTVWKVLQAV